MVLHLISFPLMKIRQLKQDFIKEFKLNKKNLKFFL